MRPIGGADKVKARSSVEMRALDLSCSHFLPWTMDTTMKNLSKLWKDLSVNSQLQFSVPLLERQFYAFNVNGSSEEVTLKLSVKCL
jgi:hypothetical protein